MSEFAFICEISELLISLTVLDMISLVSIFDLCRLVVCIYISYSICVYLVSYSYLSIY